MQNLKTTRARRGLSLKALAEMSGSDASAIARYEKGQREPSARTAVMVARALGVSVEFLVGLEPCEEPASHESVCALHGSENTTASSFRTAKQGRDEAA